MLRALNFILNQLGFVVGIAAVLLLYYHRVAPSWQFFIALGLLLFAILLASKSVYHALKRRSVKSQNI